MQTVLKAKCCYGHLGGTLGNRLFDCMLEKGWFQQDENEKRIYSVTQLGEKELKKLGVNIYEGAIKHEQ